MRRPVRFSIAASILFKAESISLAAVKYWDWTNSASLLYTDVECPNTLVWHFSTISSPLWIIFSGFHLEYRPFADVLNSNLRKLTILVLL